MAALLKELGFEVFLESNASMRVMEQAVQSFTRRLHGSEVGLFYFAGHGLQVDGLNYLVPVDAEINSESDARYRTLPADWVLGKMEDAGNPVSIVVLDACRNNPYTQGFRSPYRGLAQMRSPKGSIITYATAPGESAADGEGRNGLYTKHLMRHIKARGIKVEEVFKRVREDVWDESGHKQLPWTSSSIIGDFSFVTSTMTIQTGPAEPATASSTDKVDSSLAVERERLENEKRNLEALKAKLAAENQRVEEERRLAEERARIEAERRRLEDEKQKLLAMVKTPSPAPAASGKPKIAIFPWLGPTEYVRLASGIVENDKDLLIVTSSKKADNYEVQLLNDPEIRKNAWKRESLFSGTSLNLEYIIAFGSKNSFQKAIAGEIFEKSNDMVGATIYLIDIPTEKVSRIDNPNLGWPAYFQENFRSLWNDFKKKQTNVNED